MAAVFNGRYTANIEGDFVVFNIGMRINRLRRGAEMDAGGSGHAADAGDALPAS